MGNGNFWTGVAFGALTFGAAYLATSRPCCTLRNIGFGGGYNTYEFKGLCNRHILYGETPLESFGVSNRVMSRLPLGWYI